MYPLAKLWGMRCPCFYAYALIVKQLRVVHRTLRLLLTSGGTSRGAFLPRSCFFISVMRKVVWGSNGLFRQSCEASMDPFSKKLLMHKMKYMGLQRKPFVILKYRYKNK